MIGYVEWTREKNGRRGVWLEELELLGLRVCAAEILRRERTPEAVARGRCAWAAGKLKRLGIASAVFPEKFPWTAEFVRRSVLPVDPLPLYRALAAELVRAELDSRGLTGRTAVIAVCADRMTAQLQRCVTELSMRSRYVLLDAPDTGGAFARRLCREYGVSLVAEGDPSRLARADVRVLLSPRPALEGPGAIPLYEGGPLPPWKLRLTGEESCAVPEGCCVPQLCAALFRAGALRPGQIGLEPPAP